MALRPTINSKKKVAVKKPLPKKSASASTKRATTKNVTTTDRSLNRGAVFAKPSASPKGLLRCTSCGAVYYDKHWHSASLVAAGIPRSEMADALCQSCHERPVANGGTPSGWGGEVTMEGVAVINRDEVLAQIRNIAKRALARDPEARLLKILEKGGKLYIYTSDNQLAVAMGKEVHASHKGGTLHITWSDEDKPVRVLWRTKSSN